MRTEYGKNADHNNSEYGHLLNSVWCAVYDVMWCAVNFFNVLSTAWKLPKYGVFSGPYLDTFQAVVFKEKILARYKPAVDVFTCNTINQNMQIMQESHWRID